MPEELTHRLATLAASVSQAARLAPVEAVRARGERRRTHTTLTALAAVALGIALVATTVILAGPGGGSHRNGPAEHRVWFSPEALAGLRLPHEGQPGHTLREGLDEPSVFQPCAGVPVSSLRYSAIGNPTLIGRVAARTVVDSAPAGSERLSEQVLAFSSVDLAAGALRELVDGASSCGWHSNSVSAVEADGVGVGGGGGYVSLSTDHRDDQGRNLRMVVVYRLVNAVAIAVYETPGADTPGEPDATMILLLPRLCAAGSVGMDERACARASLPELSPPALSPPGNGASPS